MMKAGQDMISVQVYNCSDKNKVFNLNVSKKIAVSDLKWRIQQESGVCADHQKLTVGNRSLEDDKSLEDQIFRSYSNQLTSPNPKPIFT